MLTTNPTFNLLTNHEELFQKALIYEAASLSFNTQRSYKSMCKKFQIWCVNNSFSFLPTSAEIVALYLTSIGSDVSFSTLDSTIAAIEKAHEKAGVAIKGESSIYRRIRKGIRRTHKENQTKKQAKALTILDLKFAFNKTSDNLKDIRDKALLLTTFFGAFRRSEIVSLNVENIEFTEKGIVVSLLQSKTSDLEHKIYIAYTKDCSICPVISLKKWIEVANLKQGPLFLSMLKGGTLSNRLSGHAVSEIIKRYFGLDYSGHSARRGLVTSSVEKNTPLHIVKRQSRHKSTDMLITYIEEYKGFNESAVTSIGI